MSLRPVIFISAVSKELKCARQLVADTLTSLGYEPDWQDIFGTEAGDLTAMLRRKVDAASAVVQLVGRSYGAEPAARIPGFGRVSYTQYEARYALSRGNPDTLSSITNVAVALSSQGQHAPALEMYKKVLAAHEHARGPDAPESIRSRINVAMGLRQLQRWREAFAEAQTALEASMRVLGKEHPDTIESQALVDDLKLKL